MTNKNDPARSFREQMPITKRFAYFDHAAVSPLPLPTQQAMTDWVQQAAEYGDTVWPEWERRVNETRFWAAQMIGADTSEIALVPNTTTGIGLVAEGFPWKPGDNVVAAANEFPSNLYPWLNLEARGVEVRRVPPNGVAIEIDRLAAACDARTRMIAVSWVGFATGWRLDVDELVEMAHSRNCLVFLDAIQGLGVFPIDVRETRVDFLAADGHKWMLGPEGAGVFYVRQEHLPTLRPIGVGWNSVLQPYDFSRIDFRLRPAASRYEGGSQNMVGMMGLGASIQLLLQNGVAANRSDVARRVLSLGNYACERLESIGAKIISDRTPKHASGIISFDLPGSDLQQVRQRCLEKGVALSCRGGWLRISPHGYNNEDDVDRLIHAI